MGATRLIPADVRVIAATNQSLQQQVAVGRFREDLFYRLNVVKLQLPPLAQRREDIPLLVQHFIDQLNTQQGTRVQGMSEEALQQLMRHPLPGNIRQLQNIVEYAMVLCRAEVIEPACLPPDLADAAPAQGPGPLGQDPLRRPRPRPFCKRCAGSRDIVATVPQLRDRQKHALAQNRTLRDLLSLGQRCNGISAMAWCNAIAVMHYSVVWFRGWPRSVSFFSSKAYVYSCVTSAGLARRMRSTSCHEG